MNTGGVTRVIETMHRVLRTALLAVKSFIITHSGHPTAFSRARHAKGECLNVSHAFDTTECQHDSNGEPLIQEGSIFQDTAKRINFCRGEASSRNPLCKEEKCSHGRLRRGARGGPQSLRRRGVNPKTPQERRLSSTLWVSGHQREFQHPQPFIFPHVSRDHCSKTPLSMH